MKIWTNRAALIGDMIADLPILNYLEEKYPDSYKYFFISNKCRQAAPLFINHPLIDKIIIGKLNDGLTEEEIKLKNSCDIIIEESPQHQNPYWYNTGKNMTEEGFFMRDLEYKESYGKPKLNRWWDNEEKKDVIAVWPFAGYSQGLNRSPSQKWWYQLLATYIELNFQNYPEIYHFGHPNEPRLFALDCMFYHNMTHLSFFEQIKLAAECKISVGTDSGSSHVMGALGIPQINLLTNHEPNHSPEFPLALAPLNYNNNATNLFAEGSCNNIKIEKVLELL